LAFPDEAKPPVSEALKPTLIGSAACAAGLNQSVNVAANTALHFNK